MAERIRIVGLGDSTTAGTPIFLSPVESPPDGKGDEKSQYSYWVMKAHPEWEVLNRGVNGERTDEVLMRFQRDVASVAPRFVVVLAGVNDIYQGYPFEFTTENLGKMYELVEGIGASPIACSILPYNTMSAKETRSRRELNKWIESKAREWGIGYADTAGASADRVNPDKLAGTPDGLHPDVQGYKRMGAVVAMALEESMA